MLSQVKTRLHITRIGSRPAGFFLRESMLEINTPSGWMRIQLQEQPSAFFDGAPIHVDADPCSGGYQALLNARAGASSFRADGITQLCSVDFNDAPIMEAEKIPYCVLRLKPAA